MIKLLKKIFLTTIATACILSCDTYLDVEPKSSLSENNLFSSSTGYQQALTGIYALMAAQDLYGDNLSLGFVSALAQNYKTEGSFAPFVQTRAYNYDSDEVVIITNAIWDKSYNLIASANKIIENSDSQTDILTSEEYSKYKGEALTLRAYLHFELLRMFGKSYIYGPDSKSIPYKTAVNESPTPPSTTKEVLDLILLDLNDAIALLQGNQTTDYTSLSSRFTANYYVAKALQARVYLYYGKNEMAYSVAKEVIESTNYTFVAPSSVSAQPINRDRLFTPELIFALRVKDISNWEQNYFHFYLGSSSNSLTRPEADFNAIYEVASGGGTDIRRLYLFEYEGANLYPTKFWQTSASIGRDTRLDQIVPLIRLTEMYYILAETSTNLQEGVDYLNKVLENRNVNRVLDAATITSEQFQNEIRKEHQKEFYAEGQLFYYYKRHNDASINFYDNTLSGDTYVLPIPDKEKEFNPNYK
jgi:hypothetical protein